jgi:hypothetical protein
MKKSSRTARRTWIERCLTSATPSNEVSQRLSTLTAVTEHCLCVDHESRDLKSALRAWQYVVTCLAKPFHRDLRTADLSVLLGNGIPDETLLKKSGPL